MSKVEYLSIIGALLFGLAMSFYFISWARLAQDKRFVQEWRYFAWSFPFFMTTLILWYADYDALQAIESFWDFLFGFFSVGFLFLISAIINPDLKKEVSWAYLKERRSEILLFYIIGSAWDYSYNVLYLGRYDIPAVLLGGIVLAILWILTQVIKKEWLYFLSLLIIYAQMLVTLFYLD